MAYQFPGSLSWSTESGNERSAKGGDYANGATDVSSAVFVAVLRDGYQHVHSARRLSKDCGHEK